MDVPSSLLVQAVPKAHDNLGLCLQAFKADTMSNMLWGMARLANAPLPKAFMRSAAGRAHGLVTAFNPQELGPVLWAAARLKLPVSRAWLEAFAGAVRRKLLSIPPEAEADIVWAFAQFRDHAATADLFESVLRRTNTPLSERGAHELSKLAWAMAAVGHPVSKVWLDQVAQAATDRIHLMTPADMTHLLWAFSKFHYSPLDGVWIANLQRSIVPHLSKYSAEQQTTVSQAFSTLTRPLSHKQCRV